MSANNPRSLVVLIEDHDEYRRSLESLLNGSGEFECVSFSTGEEALLKMNDLQPLVVVMDINLPGINGIQCTRAIKERWPELQVLMCTVYEDDDKLFDALKAGASGYLLKRAPIEEIFDGIKQVLLGGSPMSAGIARKVVGSFQVKPLRNGEKLSEREVEVLDRMAEGLRLKEVADRLNVSLNTIRTHVRHIYEKLQVQSRTEALNKAHWPRGKG